MQIIIFIYEPIRHHRRITRFSHLKPLRSPRRVAQSHQQLQFSGTHVPEDFAPKDHPAGGDAQEG